MRSLISPSLMCADFLKLGEELKKLEDAGIEYLHMDIMDGEFVPNYTLGVDFIKKVKAATTIPMDIHMMVNHPEGKLDWIPFGEGDYVAVHYEACTHLQRALSMIRARGGKPMLALNPATPLSVIEEVLPDIDAVLVMTVNPGFAGQKLIPATLHKIERLRKYLDENGYGHVEIECDGNVSFENAKKMREAGANIFVAGTSSIYAKTGSFEENIAKLREAIR
ncbi:MAG: ribulose-phosphate 3-epimerase [Clostridia bacterium]|nr:ribulose-phosphate 3-epimerase [Clostridia bacterium]